MSFVSVMRGSRKASADLCLVFVLAALLAAGPPTRPAAADTVRAADDADRPAGGEGVPRPESYTREPAPSTTEAAKLESLLGRELKTRDDDPGRIVDILADRDGRVQAAVVELGGFLGIGTRKIAVDWSMLRFEAGPKQPNLVLDMTRDQLRSAAEYRANAPAVYVGGTD